MSRVILEKNGSFLVNKKSHTNKIKVEFRKIKYRIWINHVRPPLLSAAPTMASCKAE